MPDPIRPNPATPLHEIQTTGEPREPCRVDASADEKRPNQRHVPAASITSYLLSIALVLLATLICLGINEHVAPANLIMIYLLAVAAVANRFGRGEAILSSVLSVLAFDLVFVAPRWTLAVSDTQYFITFGVMLTVGLLISQMTLHIRREATSSSERERRTASLYELSKELSRLRGKREIALAAAKEIREVFDGDAVILLTRGTDLQTVAGSPDSFQDNPRECAVADWVIEHGEPAGLGTETLPSSVALYLPLKGASQTLGVLGLRPKNGEPIPSAQRFLLETFVNGVAVAIERANLAKEFHEARVQVESEKIRSALLSSISHDLRTPLTSIAGAASSLHEGLGDPKALADSIYQESMRLNLQVQNLLDMTRLQSGDVELNLDWQSIEELVGSALRRSQDMLADRPVEVIIPPEVPLLDIDGGLIETVLVNLFENIAAHTPTGSPVEVTAEVTAELVRVAVADHGPGIPKASEAKVFERFFGRKGGESGGFGLGLTICRAIMRLHNGRIWAKNRDEGSGAVFYLEFPKPENPPEVPVG